MSARSPDDVIATIAAAPFGEGGWNEALSAITSIVGGWAGQMLAQNADHLRFNNIVNWPEEAVRSYVTNGAADPARNPRLIALLESPLLRPKSEQHFVSQADRYRYPIYQDYFDPYDASFLALVKVAEIGGVCAAVTVTRSKRSGDFDLERLDLLGKLAPHVRAAFDVQMSIETEAVNMALGALEDFALDALVCDVTGQLITCSPGGEALLRSGAFLSLRAGKIRAANRTSGERLDHAMRLARSHSSLDTRTSSTVVLVDPASRRSRSVKVAPFPRHSPWGLVGGVLLAIEAEKRGIDVAQVQALGLTAAEAEVATWVAQGASVDTIAARRGVSRETVRSQLKSVYAQFDVHSAAQLGAKLRDMA